MRRCRMAHLHGEKIEECFPDEAGSVPVNGFVHSVRPDLTCWPLRWTITIEAHPVQTRALALAG